MISFLKYLKLIEDAGPLGAGAADLYINGKEYKLRGVKSKTSYQDDDGENIPKEEKKERKHPEDIFTISKKEK